jgi:hypothetical protein
MLKSIITTDMKNPASEVLLLNLNCGTLEGVGGVERI